MKILFSFLLLSSFIVYLGYGPQYESFRSSPSPSLLAVDTVIIEYADKLTRTVRDGFPVQELEGNVRLSQNETLLRARKVTRYLTKDEILLDGNVIIIEDTDSIFADRVLYDTERKIGYAVGNVRLSDGEVEVLSESSTYFNNEKRALFEDPVRLIDSLTVLTSLEGEYFSDERRAEFFKEVVLEEDQTYLEADSVTYFRETEISYGYGNVAIERRGSDSDTLDSSEASVRTFLFGDYAFNDNQIGYSLIEGNAFLFRIQMDSLGAPADSLLIQAASLESFQVDSLQRLIAVDSVKIWRDVFSAVSDSAVYDRLEVDEGTFYEENRLFKGPIAWFDAYQLSGDSLVATSVNGRIDSLFTYQNTFVAHEDSATNKINQLKGENLAGHFEQDSLKNLVVGPQAETIYYKQEEEGQVGAIKASGDQVRLNFKENEIEKITFTSGVQGEYYDSALIPNPFELAGFNWLINLKPVQRIKTKAQQHEAFIEERLTKEPFIHPYDSTDTPVVSSRVLDRLNP